MPSEHECNQKCCHRQSMLKYRHLLSEEYSHIVPLPCALHVANLLSKDICRLEGLMDIVKGNCKIMNFFVKSHKWFHASQEWAKKNKNNKYSFESLCETHWYSMSKVCMLTGIPQIFCQCTGYFGQVSKDTQSSDTVS